MLLTRRGLLAGLAGAAARPRKKHRWPPVAMKPDETGIFPFIIVGGSGSASGVFVYDPTIATGDLIASVTDATTSPTADTTQQGLYSYVPGVGFVGLGSASLNYGSLEGATRIAAGGVAGGGISLIEQLSDAKQQALAFISPRTQALAGTGTVVLWVLGESKDGTVPAQVLISGQTATPAPATTALFEVQGAAAITTGGLAVTGGETADTVAVSSSQAAGDVLTVTNTHGAPTNPSMQITAQSSGDLALGIEVTGDADERLAIRSNGELDWSSGAAAADVKLNRSAAGTLSLTVADLNIGTVGRGLQVKTGANAKVGTAALVGGTVSVPNTSVTANSIILLGQRTPGGTPGALFVSAVVVGTSFTIKSTSATDTSTVGYLIVETT